VDGGVLGHDAEQWIAMFDGRVRQQRCEPLHPSVDGDVIDLDTAFGRRLLDVAVDIPGV